MKNYLSVFCVLFVLVSISQDAMSEILKIGYFSLPPHQFKTENSEDKPKGASIEYFEMIAKKMGYGVKWIGPLPLPRLTKKLKEGTEVFGTVGFPKFPAFKKFMHYADTPVYMGQPIFIVTRQNILSEINSIDDIKGFRIGLVKSKSEKYTAVIDNNREVIKLEELGSRNWIELNIKKMLSGRLDALFDRQEYTIPYVAKTMKLDHRIKIVKAPAKPTPMYVTFSKTWARGNAVLKEFNATQASITIDYQGMIAKQFDAIK